MFPKRLTGNKLFTIMEWGDVVLENEQEIKRAIFRLIVLNAELQKIENEPFDEITPQLRGGFLEIQERELKHIFDDLLP